VIGNFREIFSKIKLLILDFDGVLTDGYVYMDVNGKESIRCSHRDGMGVQLLRRAGVEVVVITNQESNYVVKRCNKMKIKCIQTRGNKMEKLSDLLKNRELREVCCIGDDVNDVEVMEHVGLLVAVADAEKAVKQVATYSTLRCGGQGAVREVCDLILHYKEVGQ